MIKKIVPFAVLLLIFIFDTAFLNLNQNSIIPQKIDAPYMDTSSVWVDSVFNTLSPKERIAQLFIVRAHSNLGKAHVDKVTEMVRDNKVGGLCFFQGGPIRQANLCNYYQSIAKTPLIIAMDAEWGLAMRLDSTIKFPRQLQLGAIRNDSLIYEMGVEIGRQCNRMGVHINFAPVVDVNNNPKNKVIGNRSFGDNKDNVARKGIAYMNGLQDMHVLPTAKHFPGHGDTDKDSHFTLPVINHTKERLDSVELYPFRKMIDAGLGGVMVAHLQIPSLEPEANTASSLSKKIVTDLLRTKYGFKGIITSDALGMKGISNHYKSGAAAVKAFKAGNDILLLPLDITAAIDGMMEAVKNGEVSQTQIDTRCKRILALKEWSGLSNYKPIEKENLVKDLNSERGLFVKRQIIEASVGLLQNKNRLLPFMRLDTVAIASVSIGVAQDNDFHETIGLYAKTTNFNITEGTSSNILGLMVDTISKYDVVVVSLHDHYKNKITTEALDFLTQLSRKTKVVVCAFTAPSLLPKIEDLHKLDAILLAYSDDEITQNVVAQMLFGGIETKGSLPINMYKPNNGNFVAGVEPIDASLTASLTTMTAPPANDELLFDFGSGINTKRIRLKYTVPQELNIDKQKLLAIDSIVDAGIQNKSFPGCQILAAKGGKIFYHKSFGYHTYDKQRAVANTDIYDLASVTKISATLPVLMKFVDMGLMDVDRPLSEYLKVLETSDKKKLIIRDILRHQAKLTPWIPFYLKNMGDPKVYSTTLTKQHNLQVADDLYITSTYADTIVKRIMDSKLLSRKRYNYSDLGFILFGEMIKQQTGKNLNDYTQEHFYKQLGALSTGYLPLNTYTKDDVIPTENDMRYRHQQIDGFVHDQSAAMLGGIAGHAGLFSNANDLAKLMQMYMQKGQYANERYLSEETMNTFTSAPKKARDRRKNRRALGFDKPIYNKKGESSYSWLPSESFGHTGFTGTMVWVDPVSEIVYIFLSNRVYPDAENRKLIADNTRRKIQKIIYQACGY